MRKQRGRETRILKRNVIVQNEVGLHARPAKNLVSELNKYRSDVYIEKDGYRVNAKSIIGVLTLAAIKGTELMVIAEGEDAEEVLDIVEGMFQERLGESPQVDQ
ncbi:MAG: HPr family phosphocarrier protein [Candidatus Hydrogenedentota bacterium]|nr:MAG: HPr family phosphocarrier protein [Candidatus Hydrogenedentota bacterium]